MSNLTKEQQLAVDKAGTSIIVSAGAGSGKTTVLKSRVQRELLEGVPVNKLIILTFTNNAAAEMKERIRAVIEETPGLEEQAELLDAAYITTFDSFAQSMVKKYNYLLGISKHFSIVDSSVVNAEIINIIDDIFEEHYANQTPEFLKLIREVMVKDDVTLKNDLPKIYQSLTNIINRGDFLNSYIATYYDEKTVTRFFKEYEDYVLTCRDEISDLLDRLTDETIPEKIEKNQQVTANFRNANSYDELYDNLSFRLADNRKETYTEQGVEIKKQIADKLKVLKKLVSYTKEELIEGYLATKDYAIAIIDILKELDARIKKFKEEHNAYEFNDIALKALELVQKYPNVAEEIKQNTFEIMIDEYQDTNDIQDAFIACIQKNNVYMVGDIKQSIYRFRNANPDIFKEKYQRFSENHGGFKIDLTQNFRSREEVVNNINLIFNNIMFYTLGGADYQKSHQMQYGNKAYLEEKPNHDYNLEIYAYDLEGKTYPTDDTEAFIIADDILKRIKNKEYITYFVDKKIVKRPISFRDFVILVDKSKNFDKVKKILEYKGIPTQIDKDISIKQDDEIFILKNIIGLIIAIKQNKTKTNEFRHYFMSVARSYVAKINDDELFAIFKNNTYQETELYHQCEDLSHVIDNLSNQEIFLSIIEKFDIINKTILVGNVKERIAKLEYFVNNASSLNNFGMDIYAINKYFDAILTSDNFDIKMPNTKKDADAVTLMTIHSSKGLEFNYVYIPYLNSNFYKASVSQTFKLTHNYGIVMPYLTNGKGTMFTSELDKAHEKMETLSEKIRLFYVALTRAKEKIILITNFNKKITPLNTIKEHDLLKTSSYTDILSLIKNYLTPYITNVDLEALHIDKSYNQLMSNNAVITTEESEKIWTNCLENTAIPLENRHFSKALKQVVNKEIKNKLDFGTLMHFVFEVVDFKKPNLAKLKIDAEAKKKVQNFLAHFSPEQLESAHFYKEHEILYTDGDKTYHGFIDLLIEYPDHFAIIDYKLSNIESQEYVIQLNGYKTYIENKYGKPTKIYLYSINKDLLKEIN